MRGGKACEIGVKGVSPVQTGRFTINVGGMFSGKSTELLRQERRNRLAGKRVLSFKPQVDRRYRTDGIVTHDQVQIESISVEDPNELLRRVFGGPGPVAPSISGEQPDWKGPSGEKPDAGLEPSGADLPVDVVLIDEIQFFDRGIVQAIERLIASGIDVVAAGLDMDRFGRPFGAVPHLMAIADDVRKFHAVCVDCGQDAWISHGTFESEEEIVVGESEKYVPLCRACYQKRRSGP